MWRSGESGGALTQEAVGGEVGRCGLGCTHLAGGLLSIPVLSGALPAGHSVYVILASSSAAWLSPARGPMTESKAPWTLAGPAQQPPHPALLPIASGSLARRASPSARPGEPDSLPGKSLLILLPGPPASHPARCRRSLQGLSFPLLPPRPPGLHLPSRQCPGKGLEPPSSLAEEASVSARVLATGQQVQ